MVWRVRAGASRTVTPVRPARTGTHDGLSYALWLPDDGDRDVSAGIVVVHGAGSCKENHYDFARATVGHGLGALSFDQRGHGESDGPLDARAIQDVVSMVSLLRSELGGTAAPVALRGSSLGGYVAIRAAADARAIAVVAICSASAAELRRGLERRSLRFDADLPALMGLLADGDLESVVPSLTIPILLLHARGDEQVPIQHSRELAKVLRSPASRLIELPGGHHRSIQHDEELQAVSLQFVQQALGRR
jgi:alpha-beta hydrolase superfamily lysophospholipase